MVPDLAALQTIFDAYDSYPVEADGMTRIIHAKLIELDTAHIMYFGQVENSETRWPFAPHLSIELATLQGEALIDYRARQVLGAEGATAHGVFLRAGHPLMIYTGEAFDEAPLPPAVIAFMLAPIPAEVQSKLAAIHRAWVAKFFCGRGSYHLSKKW